MATTLPTGWSQKEFDDWYADLSRQAETYSSAAIKLQSEPYIQRNVDEWLATGTTTSPLPTGWSMQEFATWMGQMEAEAARLYNQFILSRTPPELQGLVGGSITNIDWPISDPSLIYDFEFVTGRYQSGSLGPITLSQALQTDRNSSAGSDWAFDSTGRLVPFAPNVPRVTDRGLWAEGNNSQRLPYNSQLDNPIWTTKINLAMTQDAPSPFAAGTPLGWRFTATGANATFAQTISAIAPAAVDNFIVTSAMFYHRAGDPLTGPILLSDDGWLTSRDIRPDLITGRWIYTANNYRPLDANPLTVGIRIVNAGDSICMCAINVTRSAQVTTPVISDVVGNRTRLDDVTSLINANFPPMSSKRQWTVLMVPQPNMLPFIPPGSAAPNPTRRGWTCWEYNNLFNYSATGRGEIVADVMTIREYAAAVPAKGTGLYTNGYVIATGTGARTGTFITGQLTSTEGDSALGKNGTYSVHSYLGVQTTASTNIILQARLPDAMGFGFNAAPKPDDPERPNALRVGNTITVEQLLPLPSMNYGFDPQEEDYVFNIPNAEGTGVDVDLHEGVICLRGNLEHTDLAHFFLTPEMLPTAEIMFGCQGPKLGGNSTGGPILRSALFGRKLRDQELVDAVNGMQAKYYPVDYEVARWADTVVANGGTVSDARAKRLSTLVVQLKGYGIWELIDDCWPLVGENPASALTSFKQRRLATAVGSPTFTVDRGYTFNGTSSYIDTGFIPDTHKVLMAGDRMHMGIYERNNLAASTYAAGTFDAANKGMRLIPRTSGSAITAELNSALTSFATSQSDSRGLTVVTRNVATFETFKNGVSLGTVVPTTTAAVLPTRSIYIGANNNAGAPATFRASTLGFVSVGRDIEPGRQLEFYTQIQSFMTSVGAQA